MKNLPNILTLSRVAAIPLIVAFMAVDAAWAAWLALVLYVLAAATDYFDGMLARSNNYVSAFGRLLDPVADKIFVAAMLMALVWVDAVTHFAIVPAMIILLREFAIAGLREFLAGKEVVVHSSRLAKWKTGIQMTSIGFLIMVSHGPAWVPVNIIGTSMLWVAALLALISGWQYLHASLPHIGNAQNS